MRQTFEDNSYLEITKSLKPYHLHVVIGTRSESNPLSMVVSSAEVLTSDLLLMIKSESGPLILENKEDK